MPTASGAFGLRIAAAWNVQSVFVRQLPEEGALELRGAPGLESRKWAGTELGENGPAEMRGLHNALKAAYHRSSGTFRRDGTFAGGTQQVHCPSHLGREIDGLQGRERDWDCLYLDLLELGFAFDDPAKKHLLDPDKLEAAGFKPDLSGMYLALDTDNSATPGEYRALPPECPSDDWRSQCYLGHFDDDRPGLFGKPETFARWITYTISEPTKVQVYETRTVSR